MHRFCLNCEEPFDGRADKKFCSPYCKSNFNYEKNKLKENTFFKEVDFQLKINRRVLKDFNRAGKSIVRKEVLLKAGFDERYITHWWKNKKGEAYRFCYEYGYLPKKENGKEKYVLVMWQGYMERSV